MSNLLRSLNLTTVLFSCLAVAQAEETGTRAPQPPAPFDSEENEARLVKLIRQTLPPSREAKPDVAKVDARMPWSEPVGGLAARIDCICDNRFIYQSRVIVLVRLKNVSDDRLIVPAGNSPDPNKTRVFERHVRELDNDWKRVAWLEGEQFGEGGRGYDPKKNHWSELPRPPIELKPGQSCLAYLCGRDRDFDPAASMKIVLRQPPGQDAAAWSGVLETPPCLVYPHWNLPRNQSPLADLAGQVPFPDYFPELSHDRFVFPNHGFGSEDGSDEDVDDDVMTGLRTTNDPLLDALYLYHPAGLRREFERRMYAEKDDRLMKLLLAIIAAQRGGREGALFLLESMKETQYKSVVWTQRAINDVLVFGGTPDPPEWVVELAKGALTDWRRATGRMGRVGRKDRRTITISLIARDSGWIASGLADIKCRKVVPVLIDMVQRGNDPGGEISALGKIGDPRAIPVLLERLKLVARNTLYDEESQMTSAFGHYYEFPALADALVNLQAREATPVLLEHLELPYVTSNLERMGDPRAIPAMRGLIASRGRIVRNGKAAYPTLEPARFFGARLALAMLEKADRPGQLAELWGDKTLTSHQRHDVIWRLGHCGDPAAIPHLARVIKTDPDGSVLTVAIRLGLAEFKTKASVEALIDCFDVDFAGKGRGKGEGGPGFFRSEIASALQKITGQRFKADKQPWLDWWHENKERIELE